MEKKASRKDLLRKNDISDQGDLNEFIQTNKKQNEILKKILKNINKTK